MTTKVTTSDGLRLAVTERGAGEPIVFLHEYAGDQRSWDAQVADLGADHRCVTFAARGYLPSDVPLEGASYSWTRAVSDVVDLLDGLGLASAHLVGLSMGGYTALQVARLHPDRVRSVLAVGTGSGSDALGEAYRRESLGVAQRLRSDGAAAVAADLATAPNRVQLLAQNPSAWQTFVDQFSDHSVDGLALTVVNIQARRPSLLDFLDEFAGMSIPLLVVNGDEDRNCLTVGHSLKDAVDTCGLMVLPHSGHTPNLEDPEGFNAIVRSFVARAAAGTWPTRDPRAKAASMFGVQEVRS